MREQVRKIDKETAKIAYIEMCPWMHLLDLQRVTCNTGGPGDEARSVVWLYPGTRAIALTNIKFN